MILEFLDTCTVKRNKNSKLDGNFLQCVYQTETKAIKTICHYIQNSHFILIDHLIILSLVSSFKSVSLHLSLLENIRVYICNRRSFHHFHGNTTLSSKVAVG